MMMTLFSQCDVHLMMVFDTDPTAQSEWADFVDYVENDVGIAVA